jgi:hypothetical protein
MILNNMANVYNRNAGWEPLTERLLVSVALIRMTQSEITDLYLPHITGTYER